MVELRSEDSAMQIIEREDIDDEQVLFEAIDKLTSQGINAGDVKKLLEAGIYTCNGLMMQIKKHLTGIKGLSEAKVDKICEAAEKLMNFGYVTGSDVLLRRKSVIRVTTGSRALDELLGGGIETSCITEAFGEFRSGNTQLAHTLCVSTQLSINMRGGNGKVAYIDTEGTFRPDRIVPIAERFGMDAGAVLDNIVYERAYTYEHQYNLLLGLAAKMAEEPFRLLIVDSITALFRVDFTGRGELAERQQKIAQMLSRLTKIAEEFNVAVYMTNQVIADPGGGMLISDPKKPAGGHVLAHAATIRLMFRKGKGEQRVCKVFDAPNLPEAEAIFQITPGGIADAGGTETSCITEAIGEFRSGKTQLAHTLCVSTQLPINMRGGNGKVAYIDTEGTFRPDRIVPIAERFGMDAGAVLDNICFAVIGLATPPRPIGGRPMVPPWWTRRWPETKLESQHLFVGYRPIKYPSLSCEFQEPLKPVIQG